MRAQRFRRRGVTWLELLLGLGAVAVVGGGVSLFFGHESHAGEVDLAVRDAQTIHDAVLDWRADNPQGCPTLSQLKQEKRLTSQAPTSDPWGQRYRVDCSGDSIVVVSPGRDGRAGTSDDVRVPRS
jgi:hypothetical protein